MNEVNSEHQSVARLPLHKILLFIIACGALAWWVTLQAFPTRSSTHRMRPSFANIRLESLGHSTALRVPVGVIGESTRSCSHPSWPSELPTKYEGPHNLE